MRTYTRKKLQVEEMEDVQSLCRLCLGKTQEMTSIFDNTVDDVISGLPLRIGTCLGLEVSKDDPLPKFICQLCKSELDKFYTFKKNCAATYRKLKATLCAVRNIECKQNKITDTLISVNDEKSNENVIIAPSQGLGLINTSTELLKNRSCLEEGIIAEKNAPSNESVMNCTALSELNREKEDPYMASVSEESTELALQILPVTDAGSEQAFLSQHNLDEVQAQKEEKEEMADDIQSIECLPAYIVRNLIEEGVLAKKNDTLEILDENISLFNLETACGSEIIMELVEEDPVIPTDDCNKTSSPKMYDPKWKTDARCCGTCGGRFSSRGALVRHLRVHSGERPFACRTCGRRFGQREVLRRHELLHSDKLPYQCSWCPKAYTQRGALDAHARTHAPPEARPLVLHRCSRCPKVFLYPSGLSRHMSVHQGRDFPCDECSRTFNDKSSLQRHRRAHQRGRAR